MLGILFCFQIKGCKDALRHIAVRTGASGGFLRDES